MCWLIQRTAPHEPVSYWGRVQRWILRRKPLRFAQLLNPVPEGAARFDDYDAAFDVAQWLRSNEPLSMGEVIAVVPGPEASA